MGSGTPLIGSCDSGHLSLGTTEMNTVAAPGRGSASETLTSADLDA